MAEVDPDAMVIVVALVSRVEALVVASMLEAAGVDVSVGAAGHTSVEVNSLALGGHRLWVPVSQHLAASKILLEVLGDTEWSFSYGVQKAVLRVLAIWISPILAMAALEAWSFGDVPLGAVFPVSLWALTLPVNPQGRGDYFLAPGARYPAA